MALNKITLSSLTITVTLLLLLSSASASKSGISPFCKSAEDGARCTAMLNGAGTWDQAMTNVIKSAITEVKARQEVVNGIVSKLPRNLRPQTKKSIDSTCKEAFDTLISNLENCVTVVGNDPTASLKYYLTSVSFFDCKNALEEFGVSVPEVDELNDELLSMNDNMSSVMIKNKLYS